MTEVSTDQQTPEARRDAAVRVIVADLGRVVTEPNANASMVRVCEILRLWVAAQGPVPSLLSSQKKRIIQALTAAFPVIYAGATDDAGRREAVVVANSLVTLTHVWAGDDPRWRRGTAGALDADAFTLAYQLELLRNMVLTDCAERQKADATARENLFAEMRAAPSPVTLH